MEEILPEEVRALDENAEFLGVSRLQLMENAGRAVVESILRKTGNIQGKNVLILAYVGNKGGDGFVVARHFASMGVPVSLVLLSKPDQISTAEARANFSAVQKMCSSVELIVAPTVSDLASLNTSIKDASILVDAMLGTGAKGDLQGLLRTAVELCNFSNAYRVAIDVPTGVDPTTGKLSEIAFKADLTVTHHRPKTGLLAKTAKNQVGELEVASIGIPPEAELFVGPGDLRLALKPRETFSHKGQNGRLLIVGGSSRYVGAPSLAALAALKVGVDLVTVAVPSSIVPSVRAFSPDLIVVPLPTEGKLDLKCIPSIMREAENADAVVMGMGMGIEQSVKEAVVGLVDQLNAVGKPMVIDADALKALGEQRKYPQFNCAVLTPHAKEFFDLTGEKLRDEHSVGWEGRVDTVMRWASRLNVTILLKSRFDIIADGKKYKIKTIGNAGMTAGGTGDVLAGETGAILCRGGGPFRSAAAASFLNSYAGDLLAATYGHHFTARDLVDAIPHALKELNV